MKIISQKFPKSGSLKIEYSFYKTVLGKLIVASCADSIAFIGFASSQADAIADLYKRFSKFTLVKKETDAQKKILEFLKFPQKKENIITLITNGSPFQLQVWQALLDIPFGETCYYSDLAKVIGKPTAVRAVASAVASNPLAVLIPCHRVLPRSGGIGNYYWGTKNKSAILTWERLSTQNT